MSRNVPYLTESEIERDSASLLAEYERARGVLLEPPIPIEHILEKHLKLRIEFDDLHARFNVPRRSKGQVDILGAICSNGRIFIDESLDPVDHPSRVGRYHFTLAHEGGGHWRLHWHLIQENAAQETLFQKDESPKFVCRSSLAKKRVEWQADFYAACLLMPRKMVYSTWDELFPDRKPRVLKLDQPVHHMFVEIPRLPVSICGVDILETAEKTLEDFCKPMAKRFLVSPMAMRIRLEKLGLLYRTVPHQWRLTGS